MDTRKLIWERQLRMGTTILSRGTKGELTTGAIRKGSIGAYRKDTHHSNSRRTLYKYAEMEIEGPMERKWQRKQEKNKCGVPSCKRQKWVPWAKHLLGVSCNYKPIRRVRETEAQKSKSPAMVCRITLREISQIENKNGSCYLLNMDSGVREGAAWK